MKEKWQQTAGDYVQTTLGLPAHFSPAPEAERWPLFLKEAYGVSRCRLAGEDFLTLHAAEAASTPSAMSKHAEWIREHTQLRCLFVFDRITAQQRRRLIESKLPFLCPGNQLYLPDLGIDLREYMRAAPPRVSTLAAPAQVLVLVVLLRKLLPGEPFTGVELTAKFGYTKMTMARALDELRRLGWVETEGKRKSSQHRFVLGGEELWQKARPHLRSPVMKRVYLDEWFPGERFMAGETALDEMTFLSSALPTTWAITAAQWKTLQREPGTHIIPEGSKDAAHAIFEIWRYDPALLATPPLVDTFSLILSVQDNHDERVQMAVGDLLRKVTW